MFQYISIGLGILLAIGIVVAGIMIIKALPGRTSVIGGGAIITLGMIVLVGVCRSGVKTIEQDAYEITHPFVPRN